jgi:hypothetical protein
MEDLLFARVNILPILDKEKATYEILSLSQDLSFWDDYRSTRMLPISVKNGNIIKNSYQGDFEWTSFAPKTIVDWCENYLFPWVGMKSRIMLIITEPGAANKEHIDCNRDELNTRQHKLRIVLQGRTDTLYWLTDKGNVDAPNIQEAFVMDGGWPHGMINKSDKPKITLAFGAPWPGKDHYGNDITVLQNRKDFRMPKMIDHLWKN